MRSLRRPLQNAALRRGSQARIPGLQLVRLILEQGFIYAFKYIYIYKIKFDKNSFPSINNYEDWTSMHQRKDSWKLRCGYCLAICVCKDFVNIDDSIVQSDRLENLEFHAMISRSRIPLVSAVVSERASRFRRREPGEKPRTRAELSVGKMATIVNLCPGGTGYTK